MEFLINTGARTQQVLHNEVLILGGGVAGCAASIALARKGRSVTLIERELTPRHKVCGEFLSGEALEDLHALGIDVASLGAVPIDYVRLAAAAAPRKLRCLFPQPRSPARRSIPRLSPRPSPPVSAWSEAAACSPSHAAPPTSGRQPSTTAPPAKLPQSSSPPASTTSAATTAPPTPSDGSPSKCTYRLAARTGRRTRPRLRAHALPRRLRWHPARRRQHRQPLLRRPAEVPPPAGAIAGRTSSPKCSTMSLTSPCASPEPSPCSTSPSPSPTSPTATFVATPKKASTALATRPPSSPPSPATEYPSPSTPPAVPPRPTSSRARTGLPGQPALRPALPDAPRRIRRRRP